MIKKGFTLQETLITLAVIGIVAALTIPAIVKLKPSDIKTKYLKAYNTLTNVTEDLLGDSSLYWQTYNNAGQPRCFGLDCKSVPIDGSIPADIRTAISGNTNQKYARLFAMKMHTVDGISCSGNTCTFDTTDGVHWSITASGDTHNISINTKPENADQNCTYSNDCTKPALFTFSISRDGNIQATDCLGTAFLMNPEKTSDISADLLKAKLLYITPSMPSNDIKDKIESDFDNNSLSDKINDSTSIKPTNNLEGAENITRNF